MNLGAYIMKTEQIFIQNGHHHIPAILTVPKHIKGFVIMLHGTGTDKHEAGNGYDVTAKMFCNFGLASIRFDFMGFGDSEEDSLSYNFDSAVEDTMAVRNYIKKHYPESKVGIMGWSQGATIAMLAAGRYPNSFETAVLWAPALDLSILLDDRQKKMAEANGFFEMEFQWRKPIKWSKKWADDIASNDVLKEFQAYEGPVLAIAGAKDEIVDSTTSQKIISVSKNKDSRAWLLENVGHTFEVFNEKKYETLKRVIQLSADFMISHFK